MRRLRLAGVGAVLALVVLQPESGRRPLAVVGHAGPSATATTTTAAAAPATTTTTAPRRTVVSTRSSTVVRTGGRTLTVVNEGSAVVNTGGNTAIGPPDAVVANGPATAVGNLSRP
jgi:hypothetical protein